MEKLYYACSENNGADQPLICAFGFAYADCWFSHVEAHFRRCEGTHERYKICFLKMHSNTMLFIYLFDLFGWAVCLAKRHSRV